MNNLTFINKQLKMRNMKFKTRPRNKKQRGCIWSSLYLGKLQFCGSFLVSVFYLLCICMYLFLLDLYACVCLWVSYVCVGGACVCIWDSGSDRWPALGELLCMAPTLSPTPHLTTLCPIVPRYPVPHHHYYYCIATAMYVDGKPHPV